MSARPISPLAILPDDSRQTADAQARWCCRGGPAFVEKCSSRMVLEGFTEADLVRHHHERGKAGGRRHSMS